MRKTCICGLDIGSDSLKAVLINPTKNGGEIVTLDSCACQGYKGGIIYDFSKLTSCLEKFLLKLEEASHRIIAKVYINISGPSIRLRNSESYLPLTERKERIIDLYDLRKVKSQARLLSLRWDEVLLHEVPLEYMVDDQQAISNPLGLYGHKLGVKLLLVLVKRSYLESMKNALSYAGFELTKAIYTQIANNLSISLFVDKQSPYLLIDMGSALTEVSVFSEEKLLTTKIFNFGGRDVTEEISKRLKIPWELTENLKLEYGNLNKTKLDKEIVIKKRISYKPISLKDFCYIIEEIFEQYFLRIRDWLVSLGTLRRISFIVCVGGSSSLEGLDKFLEELFKLPVKVIKHEFKNLPSFYITSLGLAKYSLRKDSFNNGMLRSLGSKIIGRLKTLYQDYF